MTARRRPPAEAIMLVGGRGTRLQPLTCTTPKPMLACAGAPFLTHPLRRLAAAGVRRVVLATAYRPEVFTEHFGDGAALGLDIDYATEDTPLGTGGGIRHAAQRLQSDPADPVIVLNSDILSGHDLLAQLERHDRTGAAVTLHLIAVADARAFGAVPTDERGHVTAFHEKAPDPVTDVVNAGCYVFRRSVIDQIPAGVASSVERDTFPALLAAGQPIVGHREDTYWLDVGTPEAFVRASADLVLGRVGCPDGTDSAPGPQQAWIAADALVSPAAEVGQGSAVGAGVVVAENARVHGSVLLEGAWVGAGAQVCDSVVGRGARVGAGALVRDAVLGDRALVGAGNELRAGARVWVDAVLPDGALRFSPIG